MTPKPDGEEIAENGNRTDGSIDEEIQAHPCDDDLRHLKARGQYQDDSPDEIGQHVTDSGDQSEQRIESHIEWCPRNFGGCVIKKGIFIKAIMGDCIAKGVKILKKRVI